MHTIFYSLQSSIQSSIDLLPVDQSTPALYYNPASNTMAVRHYFLFIISYLQSLMCFLQTAGPASNPASKTSLKTHLLSCCHALPSRSIDSFDSSAVKTVNVTINICVIIFK